MCVKGGWKKNVKRKNVSDLRLRSDGREGSRQNRTEDRMPATMPARAHFIGIAQTVGAMLMAGAWTKAITEVGNAASMRNQMKRCTIVEI